jgi:sugar lactone lactonase YvrE
VPRRWLRLLLLIGALASGIAGQYWLSIDYLPDRSAAAWGAVAVCFVLLYASSRDARVLPSTDEAALSRTVEWVLFGLVLCIGTFFVMFRLSEFPPGLNHDAAWEGMYAIRILNGERYTAYANEAWGRETFTFYLKAISIRLLGATPLGVQGPSIVGGILILPFLYWWARTMFGARLALVATLLLGVSGWHLVFSRTGWRSDLQPLFTTITSCFFIRAMITARSLDFALAAIGLAATLNTYNGARAFPLLFPVWVVLVALQSWHWRGFLRRFGIGLFTFILAFMIAVAPLAWVAGTRWREFTGRAIFLVGTYSFTGNLKAAALMYNYWGNGDDFFRDTPGLEFPAAMFLAFGLLWCLARWREERAQFLLLGVVFNLLPGIASNPNLNRSIGTMPFIFLIVALGVVFFARELARLIPRLGMALGVLFLVAVGGVAMYATYVEYLSHERREVWGYYPETTVLGNFMKPLVPRYTIWVGGANFPRDTLTFLTYQGVGNPERATNFVWLDSVPSLLERQLAASPGKGLAFILANEGPGPDVLEELARRYPNHQVMDLRYPVNSRAVFAKALLVPADGQPVMPSVAQGATEESPQLMNESPPGQDPPGTLHGPRAVALTREGNIVVCDFGNNRVQEFGRDLGFVRQWGNRGQGHAEFRDPCGIAVGPTGEVFVADTWNHRVQAFSPKGEFEREWDAGFFSPRGIAADPTGSIFVADSGHNRIMRFSAAGTKELEWGTKGGNRGQFQEPIGITTDGAGNLYVCDNGNARLQIFTRDGEFMSQFRVSGWESKAFGEPYVAVDPNGTIWVTVPLAGEVRAYDKSGKLLRTITAKTNPTTHLDTPIGITYRPATKELIVSDVAGRLLRLPGEP